MMCFPNWVSLKLRSSLSCGATSWYLQHQRPHGLHVCGNDRPGSSVKVIITHCHANCMSVCPETIRWEKTITPGISMAHYGKTIGMTEAGNKPPNVQASSDRTSAAHFSLSLSLSLDWKTCPHCWFEEQDWRPGLASSPGRTREVVTTFFFVPAHKS